MPRLEWMVALRQAHEMMDLPFSFAKEGTAVHRLAQQLQAAGDKSDKGRLVREHTGVVACKSSASCIALQQEITKLETKLAVFRKKLASEEKQQPKARPQSLVYQYNGDTAITVHVKGFFFSTRATGKLYQVLQLVEGRGVDAKHRALVAPVTGVTPTRRKDVFDVRNIRLQQPTMMLDILPFDAEVNEEEKGKMLEEMSDIGSHDGLSDYDTYVDELAQGPWIEVDGVTCKYVGAARRDGTVHVDWYA